MSTQSGLKIIAVPEKGFYRCGIKHPHEAVIHAPGTFTAAQIAILKAEKNLVVVEVEMPAPEAAAGPDEKKKK